MSVALIFLPDFFTVLCSLSLSVFIFKSPTLALGTYFAPRIPLYQELPYGVSRCLLLDISLFSPLLYAP